MLKRSIILPMREQKKPRQTSFHKDDEVTKVGPSQINTKIETEPSDEIYDELIRFALSRCHSFSLVWRLGMSKGASARKIAVELEPLRIEEKETNQWPGTRILRRKALIRRYRCEQSAFQFLREPARLYAWLSPEWPEDLAFYRNSGDYWLASIAHERESWIRDDKTRFLELQSKVPGLQLRFKEWR